MLCWKVRYPTQHEARSMVRGMRQRGSPAQRSLQHYKCGVCGGWHLGNHTRGEKGWSKNRAKNPRMVDSCEVVVVAGDRAQPGRDLAPDMEK